MITGIKFLCDENTDQGMSGAVIMPSGKQLVFGTLPDKHNMADVSAIPYGKYTFRWTKSSRRSKANREKHQVEIDAQPVDEQEEFAKKFDVYVYQMYDSTPDDMINDLVDRDAIQIHLGNYFGDTSKGWRSDVLGCFVLGMAKGRDGKTQQRMVVQSGQAMELFEKETRHEDIEVEFMAKAA